MLTSTEALRFVPSVVDAVMRVVPTFLPVTTPSLSTVAMSGRLLVHINFWLSAANGSIVTFILPVFVLTTDTGVLGNVIEPTGKVLTSTLNVLDSLEPSVVSAFTLAVPTFKPVNTPSSVTMAISGVKLDHLSFLLSASDGVILVSNCVAIVLIADVVCNEKSLTINGITFIEDDAIMPVPSFVIAVIATLPTFFPVTIPLASTVATSGSSELHSSSFVPAFSGIIVYSNLVDFVFITDISFTKDIELAGYNG